MSLILALSPSNTLIAELPSANGSRRKVNLSGNKLSQTAIENAIEILRSIGNIEIDKDAKTDNTKSEGLLNKLQNKILVATEAANALSSILKEDNTCLDTIYRILEAQIATHIKIGEDGNPTDQQIWHWEKHADIWGDPMCPFCRAEGKFEPGKNRERGVKGLSENEALRLGLIYRGYKQQHPKDPTLWTRTNYPTCYLLSDGRVLDSKKIKWLKSHREALIQDGKIHAKDINFVPLDTKVRKNKDGSSVRKLVKRLPSTKVVNTRNLIVSF